VRHSSQQKGGGSRGSLGRATTSQRRSRQAKKSRHRRERARSRLQRVTGQAPRIRLEQRSRLRPSAIQWNLVAIGLAIVFGLAGAVAARPVAQTSVQWWQGSPLTIQRMAVLGRESLSATEIAAASGLERGTRLDEIDPGAVSQRLADHDWIARADVVVLPQGTTLLEIEERVPAAILFMPGESEPRLVDAAGTPFTPARPEDLADSLLVRLHRPNEAGQAPPGALLAKAIQLAHAVSGFGSLEGVEIEIPPSPSPGSDSTAEEGFVLRSADGALTILLGQDTDPLAADRDDLSQRLDRLREILDANLFEAPASGQIDLRFEDQAVLRGSLRPATKRDTAARLFSEGEG